MGNIIDYIQWRGDLSFQADPFNEVDNVALCLLSYVNLDRLLPIIGESFLSLKELSSYFFECYSEQELEQDKTFFRYAPFLMKNMAQSERFQNIFAGNYVNYIEPSRSLQMSAIEILLPDNTIFVAFRGTDDRLLSWKEDFFLATGEVAAQIEAVKYLNDIGSKYPKKMIRLGGHSKGGNMAVYAAANCNIDIQQRIEIIYNNDGPGFRSEFLESPGYESIKERIHRIIPENAVVGMLLQHRSVPNIVKSTGKGIMQHDGMTWQVLGNRFERANQLSASSITIDTAMTKWIESYDDNQKLDFVNDVFSVLEAPGVETLTELQNGGIPYLKEMKKKYEAMNGESRQMIDLLLRELVGQWSDYLSGSLKDNISNISKQLRERIYEREN